MMDSFTKLQIPTTIKLTNRLPEQIPTPLKIRKSVDCYQQQFIKFPNIGIFHNYSELLFAAMLEAENSVISFIPKPFKFKIGKTTYIPDFYSVRNGQRIVVDISPGAKLPDNFKIPITERLNLLNIKFKTIASEHIMEKERFAKDWLYIIRTLLNAQKLKTEDEELTVWEKLNTSEKFVLREFVNSSDRIYCKKFEIALFRLAHRGKINLNIKTYPLSLDTEIYPCT